MALQIGNEFVAYLRISVELQEIWSGPDLVDIVVCTLPNLDLVAIRRIAIL